MLADYSLNEQISPVIIKAKSSNSNEIINYKVPKNLWFILTNVTSYINYKKMSDEIYPVEILVDEDHYWIYEFGKTFKIPI